MLVTDDDDVVPTQRQHELADRIPGATVQTIRGGHSVCTTQPERFVPTLVDACRQVAALQPVAMAA